MKSKKLFMVLAGLMLILSVLACSFSSAPAGVSNVRMAKDQDGNTVTTTFAPTDTVYVLFDINQVDAGAKFEVKWYALNIDGQDPTTPFTSSDYTYTDEQTLYANISSTDPGGFPTGQFKVEIYLNGAKAGEQQFSIQ